MAIFEKHDIIGFEEIIREYILFKEMEKQLVEDMKHGIQEKNAPILYLGN